MNKIHCFSSTKLEFYLPPPQKKPQQKTKQKKTKIKNKKYSNYL